MTLDAQSWNDTIRALPGAHLLQTWQWAQFKHLYGWQPLPQVWRREDGQVWGAGMVLQRTVSPLRLRILYVPCGPLLNWDDAGLRQKAMLELEKLARRQGAIFIKMDPGALLGTGVPGEADAWENPQGSALQAELAQRGWRYSPAQVQFRNTAIIDLSQPEDEWLASLKQKARYNLRLGEKRGVTVRVGTQADLELLYRMYAETSVRDGFLIRSREYYETLWRAFMAEDMAEALIAEVEGEPVAAITVFYFAGRAWYLQGMSRDLHRERMPNYTLQWAAMRRARARGCRSYDLWGAPEVFNEQDPLWGVFRFKDAIGGKVVRSLGAWDFASQPLLYHLYTNVFPRILNVMRKRGRERTRQEVSV